jgi:hypothetical protein
LWQKISLPAPSAAIVEVKGVGLASARTSKHEFVRIVSISSVRDIYVKYRLDKFRPHIYQEISRGKMLNWLDKQRRLKRTESLTKKERKMKAASLKMLHTSETRIIRYQVAVEAGTKITRYRIAVLVLEATAGVKIRSRIGPWILACVEIPSQY